ncbi:GH92 family glycosyl hydrolase [Streptomyces nanshensis]|uniref:GH92 family glycosyl hydrolase n=1 Tax=Streptomyces nanshensis TaxID=518642 RepID=UPI00085C4A17|nr:GH92 family glycosyl hydrolase [Streptomyces nanshensis]
MSSSGFRHRGRLFRPLPALAVAAATVVVVPVAVAPAASASPPRAARAVDDPAQYVDPFTGTQDGGPDYGHGGGAGNNFPGAVAPFGMMQWSPDTVDHKHGGYEYDDDRIRGFSLTHISGAGCSDFGNIPFMPVLGDSPVESSTFSHDNESASPGSYGVTFDNGLKTELTTAKRSGMARFTYPEGEKAALTVDAAKAFNDASGEVTIGARTLSGYSDSGGFCGTDNTYRVYFHATFDRDFDSGGVVEDGTVDTSRKHVSGTSKGVAGKPDASAKTAASQAGPGTREAPTEEREATGKAAEAGAQALVGFDTSQDRTVEARVGISFVSLENAEANVAAEQDGKSFEELRDGSRGDWNGMLGRIAVGGGSESDRRRFYTALYHSLIHPNVFSDSNGEYTGFDEKVHKAADGHAQYADYSGWDVYRSQVQLVALIAPHVASDIAQSATNQAVQGGYFDRWTVANGPTGVMVGDPLPIVVSSVHAFGATDFDSATALERMVDGASNADERPGYADYDSLGYLPAGNADWGSVSTTLEYTSADFAVAQLAQRLGDDGTHRTFLRRSQSWKNLFNPDNKYLQPRKADGSWTSFSPTQDEEYVEGNGEQYTWMVPYNQRALYDLMGGDAEVTPRLDAFFSELNAGPDKPNAYLSNEPSANTPWAYDYTGAPYKTQDVVRRALTELFKAAPDGLTGNDDLGQMSSWAVWASLGMYPETPGRSELVLASPLFESVTVDRGDGRKITVNAEGASDDAKYVHGLKVNGETSTKPWLSEKFVAEGGTLDFTLGTEPDAEWGSDPGDAPPSFDAP